MVARNGDTCRFPWVLGFRIGGRFARSLAQASVSMMYDILRQ